jgi:hypothetical protein
MHPMFVTLFIETDADDPLMEERAKQRRARLARRSRSTRIVRVPAHNQDRQRRP